LLESRQSVSANKVEDDGLDMYKDDFDQEFQANPKQQSFEEIFMMQQAAPQKNDVDEERVAKMEQAAAQNHNEDAFEQLFSNKEPELKPLVTKEF